MIRYPDALNGLDTAIDAVSPTWRVRASERTAIYQSLGGYTEGSWMNPATGRRSKLSPFWGLIKKVYMRRQSYKCVYCEKRLEAGKYAEIEWDLEHFRPKGAVRAWRPKRGMKPTMQYDFPLGDASPTGSFLLAYHPFNYAAACKTCNSPFKSNCFPVPANRSFHHLLPDDCEDEMPYLPFPLGNRGDAPESLIGFVGATAVPRCSAAQDLHWHRRGCVTIDFFGLNREGLVRERAWWLRKVVWKAVRDADDGKSKADEEITELRSEKSPFTNCTRYFLDLCRDARPTAESMLPGFDQTLEM